MTRTTRRKKSRSTWRPGPPQFRPSVESLEARALMTGGGGLDRFAGPYEGTSAVATGTDGDLYVLNSGTFTGTGGIVQVAPDGTPLATYPLPTGMEGYTIAAATDGGIWVQGSTTIVRLAPDGTMAEYSIRSNYLIGSTSLAAGPDGSVWFTNNGESDPSFAAIIGVPNVVTPPSIGLITPDGTVTDYPVTDGTPDTITAGPNGSADFVITKPDGSNAIGQVNADGSQGEIPLPAGFNNILSLTMGPDGNIWFLNDNAWTLANIEADLNPDPVIGRLTPAGVVTTFSFTSSKVFSQNGYKPPGDLISAPDGNLYFFDDGAIGRVTTSGEITEVAEPSLGYGQGDTVGPDGNLWFAVGESGLERFTIAGANFVDPPPPSANPPSTNPPSGLPVFTPIFDPGPTPIPSEPPGLWNGPIDVVVPIGVVDPILVVNPIVAAPTPIGLNGGSNAAAPVAQAGGGQGPAGSPANLVAIAPSNEPMAHSPGPVSPRAAVVGAGFPAPSPSSVISTEADEFIPLMVAGSLPTAGPVAASTDVPTDGSLVKGHRPSQVADPMDLVAR